MLHRGYQHIRLSSSFSLTLDIQDYLRSLAKDEKGIDSIQFYMDQQHFTLRMKEGFSVLENAEAFLKKIDKGKVSDLMTLPIRREESAYSIVSGAAIKRLLFRSFVPYPIRYIWTCYQALGYVKEAYQTLARKELTMEVLDCSAILLSLFMNQPTTVDKEPLFSNETTPFSFYNLSFSVSYLLLIERLRRTILKVVRLCNIERLDGLNQFNNPNPIKLPFITTVS